MNNTKFGEYSGKGIYFQQMKPIVSKSPNPSITGKDPALNLMMSATPSTTTIISPCHLKILQ